MLFRPEECIVASAAPAEHQRFRWVDLHDPAMIDDGVDSCRAMRAGVEDFHGLAGVIAADQQQEVDRSGDVEPLARGTLHRSSAIIPC